MSEYIAVALLVVIAIEGMLINNKVADIIDAIYEDYE